MFLNVKAPPAYISLMLILSAFSTGCGEGYHEKGEREGLNPAEERDMSKQSHDEATRDIALAGPSPADLQAEVIGADVRLTWTGINPGDYNTDGTVSGLDIFPLAANFQEDVAGNPGNECIDGNSDGTLSGLDLFTVSVNFGNRIDEYRLYSSQNEGGPFDEQLNTNPINYVGCGFEHEYPDTGPDLPLWYACTSVDNNAGEESEPGAPVQAEPSFKVLISGIQTVNEPYTELKSSLDGNQLGLVFYLEDEGRIVFHEIDTGLDIGPEELVASGEPFMFGPPQLAYSPLGEPAVLWVDYEYENPPDFGRIAIAYRDAGVWTTETVTTMDGAYEPDLDFTPDGDPTVAFNVAFDSVYYGKKGIPDWTFTEVPRGQMTVGNARPQLREARNELGLPTSIAFFHDDWTEDGSNPRPALLYSALGITGEFEPPQVAEELGAGLFIRELVNLIGDTSGDTPEPVVVSTKSNGPQRGVDSSHRQLNIWYTDQITSDEEEGSGIDGAERPWNGEPGAFGYTWYDPDTPEVSHLRVHNALSLSVQLIDYTFTTWNYTSIDLSFFRKNGEDKLLTGYWDEVVAGEGYWVYAVQESVLVP